MTGSESMTALAVLRLADAGRVELDAPVRTYLPEFVLADEPAARITVRVGMPRSRVRACRRS